MVGRRKKNKDNAIKFQLSSSVSKVDIMVSRGSDGSFFMFTRRFEFSLDL